MRLQGKHIVLGVSGSVAAYKAVQLARLLVKEGARVTPVLTEHAQSFVGAATFSAVTGERAVSSMWDEPGEVHISLTASADAIVIVPATADLLARMAEGRGNDLVSALYLCARQPVLCAPAMHPRMWAHPAVRRNVDALRRDGLVEMCGPVVGEVASGETGEGRMVEPEAILELLVRRIAHGGALRGKRAVVTAGPTFEDIDPVRFLGNRSSGTMGFAIAQALRDEGADVTLITGPVSLQTPGGVSRIDVRRAEEMRDKVAKHSPGADIFVMAAAVADFRPTAYSNAKLKKSEGVPVFEFVKNTDILSEVCASGERRPSIVVGFALETGGDNEVSALGREKRVKKGCDMLVANRADQGLGPGETRICLIDGRGEAWFGPCPKPVAARAIVGDVVARISALDGVLGASIAPS